jgi:hypothetical protein
MPGRERVVDGRVTQGALDAHRGEATFVIEDAGDAEHGIELE